MNVKPDELSAVFSANLRRMRSDRGWTQSDLARELSRRWKSRVHVPYVSDLERGKKTPSIETLARLSEVFGIQPSELLSENSLVPA